MLLRCMVDCYRSFFPKRLSKTKRMFRMFEDQRRLALIEEKGKYEGQ